MTGAPSNRATTLLWYRDDLRTLDHEALTAARAEGDVIALWIREARNADGLGPRPLGEAASWWAHESLHELQSTLDELGIPLIFASGEAGTIVPTLARAIGADTVRWSRRYAPRSRELDRLIKSDLDDAGITAHSHPGALLVEPWQVAPSSASDFYKVFTPFWNAARDIPVAEPLPAVPAQSLGEQLRASIRQAVEDHDFLTTEVADLGLLTRPTPGAGEDVPAADSRSAARTAPAWWESTIARHWTPGCRAGLERLDHLGEGITDYATDRDLPGQVHGTSEMSPRLRFGEISPRQLFTRVQAMPDIADDDRQAWVRQLYWREFSWHLTFHIPELEWRPIRPEFANFPYTDDAEALSAWQQGRTGIALVDAGMRQLWETGWMHNRVRMVTASLLTKNLLQPWQAGEQWFWNTLVDADEANNPVSWQWVAGCGADASPFFRIFNPERQRSRFDPDGAYVARWVPELAQPADTLFDAAEDSGVAADSGGAAAVDAPAKSDVPAMAGEAVDPADSSARVPAEPIVDLGESRLEALAAYEAMKNS